MQSIQNTCRASQFTPPPPLSTGNPGRIGGGISQSKLESLKGSSFPVPSQQLSKMHVEHDHSPTSPSSVGKTGKN
jgi:hypothetical protein